MAKNNSMFFMIGVLVLAYVLVPGFKEMVNGILGGPSGGDGSTEAEICPFDLTTLYIGEEYSQFRSLINGVEISSGPYYDVVPGDYLKVFNGEQLIWEEEIPCKSAYPLQFNISEDINMSATSGYQEDMLDIDYGLGGMTLPELDDTIYDFESFDELNLDI